MLLDDIIKIKYSEEGYLPSYPPHLISNSEMCAAFFYNDISYFGMNYPLVGEKLAEEYQNLKDSISYHISKYLDINAPQPLPNWVYSYMLGSVVGNNSKQEDRHYLLVGSNSDNVEDYIDETAELSIYKLSQKYVNSLSINERQITVDGKTIYLRPPTMFGEPHVLKQIRLQEAGMYL